MESAKRRAIEKERPWYGIPGENSNINDMDGLCIGDITVIVGKMVGSYKVLIRIGQDFTIGQGFTFGRE